MSALKQAVLGCIGVPADAVAQSRAAQRFGFRYCSTFDSTPAGNMGR